MVQLAGFVYDSAGVALSTGITVNIYARNTVTPVVASPTVNASGYWQATGVAEGRYDVEIVNGTTTRRIKYDDEIQIERGEFKNLQVRGSDNAFALTFVLGAITAARNLTIPTLTGNDTMAVLGMAQTFTANKTFNSTNLLVRNPADTFSYTLAGGAITADRQLNLPVITATDTVAVLSLAQTFSTGVKTFNSSILAIRNPADTFSYTVVASAITAARNLTVPLLTADDTLAVLGLAQTFSATQTFSAATAAAFGSNTVTGAFTASGSTITFSGGTASTSTSTGTVVVTGGVGASGRVTADNAQFVNMGIGTAPIADARLRISNWTSSVNTEWGLLIDGTVTLDTNRTNLWLAGAAVAVATTASNFNLTGTATAYRAGTITKTGAGTLTYVTGLLLEAQTAGTNNAQITIANGVTAPAAGVDAIRIWGEDIAAGDARLGIRSEAGSAIYLGNDRLRFAATTGIIGIGATDVANFLSTGQVKIAGTALRATTEGTNHLDIFDGTAPVGTLANGISLYSTLGELRVMDSAGNATLLSPHARDGSWIYDSVSPVTGKHLRVDMERMVKFLNEKFGQDWVKEIAA